MFSGEVCVFVIDNVILQIWVQMFGSEQREKNFSHFDKYMVSSMGEFNVCNVERVLFVGLSFVICFTNVGC